MALSGIQIFKLLPGTNCKDCGVATCLAFAMNLASGKTELDLCPHIVEASREQLASASAPPIRPLTVGLGDTAVKLGGETVLYRHEKTFHNPTGIAALINDNLSDDEVIKKVKRIAKLQYDRVGLNLRPELIVVKGKDRLAAVSKLVVDNSDLSVVLYSEDASAVKAAAEVLAGKNPLVGPATKANVAEMGQVALDAKCPIWLKAANISEVPELVKVLSDMGLKDIVIDSGARTAKESFEDSVGIRRAALVEQNRGLGFPTIAFPAEMTDNLAMETAIAAGLIAKYAGIVVLNDLDGASVFPLLLERLNIFTDPQRPMTVVQGIYPINNPDENSPILVTTNFSLTYFIVAAELEASRVPCWLLIKDCEGLSVLTAWAAGSFSGDDVGMFVKKINISEQAKRKEIIIPGYVASIMGDLEEELDGWNIIVAPREAAQLPAFLKEHAAS